jgi:hypothetical protein
MEPNQGTRVGFHFCNRFLGQKLLHREHLVNWSVVIVENLFVGPKFRPLSLFLRLNLIAQPQRVGIFLFTTMSIPPLGPTQPPVQWVRGALSSGVKRQERETDHLPPSSAGVKNAWSYTFTPMTWCTCHSSDTQTSI